MAATTTCPICFEETPLHSSQPCKHNSCLACLKIWFETCEVAGQPSPTCPTCRNTVDDARFVLGRPYETAVTATGDYPRQNGQQDVDDLTREWLEEAQAKPCRGCGAWILKRDGCDLMQCLCGYRFCWTCGETPGSEECCNCSPPDHYFYDNIVDRMARPDPPGIATWEELQDLRGFIENHKTEEAQAQRRDHQQWCKEATLNAIQRGVFDIASIYYKDGKYSAGGKPPDWAEELKPLVRHLPSERLDLLFPGLEVAQEDQTEYEAYQPKCKEATLNAIKHGAWYEAQR